MSIKNFKIIFIGTLNIVLLGSISLVNARHRGGVSAVAEQTDDNQKDRLLQQDQAQIASLQKQLAAQSNGGSDANDEDDDDNSAYADSSGDSGDSSGLGGSGDLSGSGSTDSSSSSSSGMTADQQAQIAAMMGGGGGDQGGGDSQSAAAPGGVSAVLGSVMNSPYAMLIQTLLFAGGPLVEVFHLIYNFISKTIHTGDTKAINGAIAEINKQYETATKNIIEEKSRLQELLDAESTTIPQKAIIKLELEKLDLAHDIARKFGEATTKVKAVIDEKGYLPEAEKAKLFDELKNSTIVLKIGVLRGTPICSTIFEILEILSVDS